MSAIKDILYVRFKVSDLEKQRQFLLDFGFAVEQVDGVLLARGTDASRYIYIAEQADTPEFVSVGFEASSTAELEALAARDGCPVEDNDLPGGGKIVRLTDPSGIRVEVVFGLDPVNALPVAGRNPLNKGETRPRIGERVTYSHADVIVKRLGHAVLFVNDFKETFDWYHERLNLIISDEIVLNNDGVEQTMGAFTRCNRGEEYVDHHTLFFIHAGKAEFNHAAFEVADWDTLMKSHFELKKAGYQHSHGVGKHILGSQVFDYWKDQDGFMLEHFTDGDLFNESFGSHKRTPDDLFGAHWGPDGAPGQ